MKKILPFGKILICHMENLCLQIDEKVKFLGILKMTVFSLSRNFEKFYRVFFIRKRKIQAHSKKLMKSES
jgi:hypothetical protein